MMPLGFVVTIGFWGALAWGAYHLISGGGWRARPMQPEDELAQRFARGDIDGTEYHERLETLRTHRLVKNEDTSSRS